MRLPRVESFCLCAVAGAILFLVGCKKSESTSAGRDVAVVISGDTGGWIVPCGCTANQSGGLLRRSTYLHKLAERSSVVYVDVGGAGAGDSQYQLTKLQAILAGEKLMGLAIHNLGKNEILLGPKALREISQQTGVRFLSSNAKAVDGDPCGEPVRIASVEGRRVAFVGVVSPSFATGAFHVDEPRQAILNTISGKRDEYDRLIVLAYLPEAELQQLVASLPEADAVIGGPTGQAITPRAVGPTLLAAATNKGKFLIQLSIPGSKTAGLTGFGVEMGPELRDDSAQVENLNSYLQKLAQADYPASQSGLADSMPAGTPTSFRLAGSSSCISCHSVEARSWQASAHAHAWETLVRKRFEVDSACQQCHTTGFGLPGGFESRGKTMALTSVGCESCHGPSAAHVADVHVHTTYSAFDQCVRCHDHENSPRFDQVAYWQKIRHGKAKAGNAGEMQ